MPGGKTICSTWTGEDGDDAATAILGLSEPARRSQFQPLPVVRSHGSSLSTQKPAGGLRQGPRGGGRRRGAGRGGGGGAGGGGGGGGGGDAESVTADVSVNEAPLCFATTR